jgi:hypothetical protein
MSTFEPGHTPAPGGGAGRSYATPAALLGCLSVLLVVFIIAGAITTWVVVDRRGSTITELEAQVDVLTAANLELQATIDALTIERGDLGDQLAGAVADLERLQGERDNLTTELSGVELRLGEVEDLLADRDRQLSELRQEGVRQIERAEDAEALSLILAEIIMLDDDIHDEFINLIDLIFLTYDLMDEGDFATADVAWELTLESIDRLVELLELREEVLAILGF